MKYCKVNLTQGHYQLIDDWQYLDSATLNINQLNEIYKKYCAYKKFDSVMPVFDSEYLDESIEKIGYYYKQELVAFSLVKIFDCKNAELLQFAWTYNKPRIRLGIRSLENECAIYKNRGYINLYLGEYHEYKSFLPGFQILGTL